MTTQTSAEQIESAIGGQNLSLWQKLLAWLTAFEQAMDYDPQEQANASISRLDAEVASLNRRLDAAAARNERSGNR